MSNSTNNPAAGPQYQPETLNPGQDAAGAVSQSGTASATDSGPIPCKTPPPPPPPGHPQQPRWATIRRATLPGQDAPAADSGPIPATAPALPEIVARLQDTAAAFEPPKIAKALQAAQTLPDMLEKAARLASAFEPPKYAKALQYITAPDLPDIVAALQKTAEKYSFPGIIADLQKVTTLQDAGILQIKTAAAVCISINATPAGISRQIDYLARLDWGKTARNLAKIDRFAAEISAYFRAELETNPYYFELVAEKEAAKETAAREKAEKEATAAELVKTRAKLELFEAAGFYIENCGDSIKIGRKKAAGPQPGHQAKQPGNSQQPRRKNFNPSIIESEILLIYDNLPADFNPTFEQFKALFGKPIKMPAPIETTPGRAAALLEALNKGEFIKTAQYASIAAACKCFKYNGKIITAVQLRRAKDSNKYSAAAGDFDYIKEMNKPR